MPQVADLPDLQIPYVDQAAVSVDGHRDEPAWANALQIPGPFVVFQPHPDSAPTGATEVSVLADAKALYLYWVCHDPEPDKIRASIGRRDTRFDDDWVGFFLDPFGTKQRAYLMVVTADGVVGDGMETPTSEDESWDGVWTSSARRTADGYEVEIAIPWRTVRHPVATDHVGLLLIRHVPRTGEKSSWPRLDPNVAGALVQEAVIGGPGPIPTDAGLDLLPELTFGWTDQGPREALIGNLGGFSPGLTVRYRPTPAVSMLGTFNPDFSQIESDASQVDVNLRDALFYQEKRPFFLDGQEWFQHPLGNLIYTRTMREPYGGLRMTVEPPKAAVAGLFVLDADPAPSVSEGGGWKARDLRGHTASEAAVRAHRDIGEDGQVAVLLSDREILGTDLVNHVGGVDSFMHLSPATTASASALLSYTTFADRAPALAPAASASVKYSPHHPYLGTDLVMLAPGFRAENGYLPSEDKLGADVYGGYAFESNSKVVSSGSFTPLTGWVGYTFEHQLRDLGASVDANANLANGTMASIDFTEAGELWHDAWLPTRTGSLYFGGTWSRWLDANASVQGGLQPYYDPKDPHSGDGVSTTGNVVVRPIPSWSIGGSATWAHFADLDGRVKYDGYVAHAKTELFLSRTIFGRVVVDSSTFDESLDGELLLAWERSPGTALYLGGQRMFRSDGWSLFAKAGVAL